MAANATTKIQVNYGKDGVLVNVYADNQAELEALLASVQDVASFINSVNGSLRGAPAPTVASVAESFGATPYLIYRSKEDGGNIMIDCPRYNSNLGKQLDDFGGIDTLIITHKDDIPEHDKWKKRYPNMQRIIHRTDAIKSAEDIEIKLEGLLLLLLILILISINTNNNQY